MVIVNGKMHFESKFYVSREVNMFKTIDLFAGAGGLSLGFAKTGKFKIIAAAEIDKNAKETFKQNIVDDEDEFVFIDNVIGYDFGKLCEKVGGIDVVIGGPPCQGFSNANRHKSNLINSNNSLVKEYFRAIKEIKPKVFVMENVNMLRSDIHRFYDSRVDNAEIDELILKGFKIPKRLERIIVSKRLEGIDMLELSGSIEGMMDICFPCQLYRVLSVLKKNFHDYEKSKKYLLRHKKNICSLIEKYANNIENSNELQEFISRKIQNIQTAIINDELLRIGSDLSFVVELQKALRTMMEIHENKLLGDFVVEDNGNLAFCVSSYAVIDYINAVLGEEYEQVGNTFNAEWFGVPQERKRYIIIGVRKDIVGVEELIIPLEPKEYNVVTVSEAIFDLIGYPAGYEKKYEAIEYMDSTNLSEYAILMRRNSQSVKNHITTKTTAVVIERFKLIGQGENFHNLPTEMKSSYSAPERTQNTIYLRLESNKPSGTVVNVRKSMWIHPTLDRAITVREAARLQSFPDEFEFIGTKDSQFQQIGNAVPPFLASGIANIVLRYIENI